MPRGKCYTDQEIQFVKDNLDKMSREEMGKKLGRKRSQINSLVSRLGLSSKLPEVNDKINRLTITKIYYKEVNECGKSRKRSYCLCDCDCGTKDHEASLTNIANNKKISCGCVKAAPSKNGIIYYYNGGHKLSKTRLYRIWQGMKERCDNPNHKNYRHYGGRGIKYLKDWNEFIPFRDWAISSGYEDGLEIDRIDVNGNYEPSNTRWATEKEQMNNTRRNKKYCIFGETKTLSEWIDDPRSVKIDYITLEHRVRGLKWPAIKAILTPLNWSDLKDNQYANKIFNYNGEEKTLLEWSNDIRCLVKIPTLYNRVIILGMDLYEAMTVLEGEKTRQREFFAFGESKSLKDWSKDPRCVVNYDVLYHRFKTSDWPLESAIITPKSLENGKRVVSDKISVYNNKLTIDNVNYPNSLFVE